MAIPPSNLHPFYVAGFEAGKRQSTAYAVSLRKFIEALPCPDPRCSDGSIISTGPDPQNDACEWCYMRHMLLNESQSGHEIGTGNPKPVGRCATTQTERYRVEGCTCPTYPGNEGLPCLTWCQSRAADRCAYCDHNLECHRRLSAMFKGSHAVVPQLGPIWMPSAPLIEKLANLRERVDAIEPADHAGDDDLERIVADFRAIEAELRECHSQGHPRAECIKECEAYLHGNGQGSICGLHKKDRDAERVLAQCNQQEEKQ